MQARVASSLGAPSVLWQFSPDEIGWFDIGAGSLGSAGPGEWLATLNIPFWPGTNGQRCTSSWLAVYLLR